MCFWSASVALGAYSAYSSASNNRNRLLDAYMEKPNQPGAWIEVPSGFVSSLRPQVRCSYCRRTFPTRPHTSCPGCGAAEYEVVGALES